MWRRSKILPIKFNINGHHPKIPFFTELSGPLKVQRKRGAIVQLADEGFEIVVNCAGLDGGRLAGDPDDTFPIRGILLKVDAPWQKHFLFRNFTTFTIPT